MSSRAFQCHVELQIHYVYYGIGVI